MSQSCSGNRDQECFFLFANLSQSRNIEISLFSALCEIRQMFIFLLKLLNLLLVLCAKNIVCYEMDRGSIALRNAKKNPLLLYCFAE